MRAVVGLGGNVGLVEDLETRFDAALTFLAARATTRHIRRASLYRTRPMGPVTVQPPFINSAALVDTDETDPTVFLASLLAIETYLGRNRALEVAQGPRLLDLDLLVFGEVVGGFSGPPPATVPHPRLAGRAFALAPLVELCGEDFVIPGVGSAGELLAAALADPAQQVLRL